jgi:5-methylcytosine-specific restriction endonuclease McrA
MDDLLRRAEELKARIAAEGFTLFWHRRATVNLLFAAQGPVCCICRSAMTRAQATIDHVTPKGRGGADRLENFLLAHESCNHARGSRPPDVKHVAMHREVLKALAGLA